MLNGSFVSFATVTFSSFIFLYVIPFSNVPDNGVASSEIFTLFFTVFVAAEELLPDDLFEPELLLVVLSVVGADGFISG